MDITSEDEALLELYENGKTSDKRYRRTEKDKSRSDATALGD